MGEKNETVTCLRKERIKVKFIPRDTGLIQDRKHILGGGMADGSFIAYTVPIIASSGSFKNVLTDNEKDCLEEIMRLEKNALSVHRKSDNFWVNYSVRLTKDGRTLDLSDPTDYIAYKVLLANSDYIAPSFEAYQNSPKATYKFMLVSEKDEHSTTTRVLNNTMKAYENLGAIKEDKDKLRFIIESINMKQISEKAKLEFLQEEVYNIIQKDPILFISATDDSLLDIKVLISKAVSKGLITKKGDYYYDATTNTPLCNNNQDPILSIAAKYLGSPKNQELKFKIEAKLKEE